MAEPAAAVAGRRIALLLATSTGGVGRHIRALAAALVADGARVRVCGPAATDELFGFSACGAQFAPVEIAAGPRPVKDLWAVHRVRRLTADVDVDVVHAHGLRAGLVATLAGVQRRRPLVVTWHNRVLGPSWRARPYAPIERRVARGADVGLGASDDLVARIRELGGRDVRLGAVAAHPLPAPDRPAAEVRAALGATDRPLVLAVGRLHQQKGLDVLVRAAAGWRDRTPVPCVAIAGSGPLQRRLAHQIAGTGAPVTLLGRRDDVADLLAAADVVVLPSRWEARALVAQEAMWAGRPLVATAVGGLPGLVADGAVLVAPDDPDALDIAVRRLLDHPEQAALLAARGRARAGTWPTEADSIDQLEHLYAEVIDRRRVDLSTRWSDSPRVLP